ncbi:hypothetical protein GC105_14890 [Alkalibaculum sp. M08DMB]|uniref:Uncharacterized protein n=1 Tax=Alkalibaculum sporogenes TaxID=2655001 RepID=A0A6A7KD21_9FIRM|nr:hypothetical protein [Alkalibaculum sporogenes]MPW27067.1 hypothetical protein [Alkalibaculum sporogenes]
MYHEFLVNQSIDQNGRVKVNFIDKGYLNWSYETYRGPRGKSDTPIFPIVVSEDALIQDKPVSRETKCTKLPNGDINFIDDYSVPGGFLICITSPPGYEPNIVKLKNKPTFNNEGYNNVIPAHFEIKSNKALNKSSVLMHVLERACFGVCIEFSKIEGSVKDYERHWFDDPYDLTLNLVNKQFEYVDLQKIQRLHPKLDEKDVQELVEILNELIKKLQSGNEVMTRNLKTKLFQLIPKVIAGSSSVVTLIDSYKNVGIIGELLTILVKLFG